MEPTTTIGRAVPLSPTARQPRGRIGLAESQTVSGGGRHSIAVLELDQLDGRSVAWVGCGVANHAAVRVAMAPSSVVGRGVLRRLPQHRLPPEVLSRDGR